MSNNASIPWTPEEDAFLAEKAGEGWSAPQISAGLQYRSEYAVLRRLKALGVPMSKIQAQRAREIQASMRKADAEFPVDVTDLEARIRSLEAENARLREQRKWETHSEAETSVGGLLTLRASDHHHADSAHLISCAASLTQKFLAVVERYQPSRLQLVMGDDWIAGRGIYREQDLDLAVSDVESQIQVGAVKWYRFLEGVRTVTQAPIDIMVLEGNHESAPGKTKLGPYLFDKSRALCEMIPGLRWKMHRHRAIINLAAEGYHNCLFYHGYGHSNISPNSPQFISGAKDDVIVLQQKLSPEQHIRRIGSGHTHNLSVDMERVRGLAFDTTGGLQRNERVQLHKSSRPVGWIVYISPPGVPGEIQQPIKLQPDADVHERELADPHLMSANKKDCAECIQWYETEMERRGLLVTQDPIGITGGRW